MSQSFNYRHLYYFWVVAKEGGIARAAERLDMAVQTISAQVRELDARLIAAAPELLAALEYVNSTIGFNTVEAAKEWAERVEKVIAKAKGETE